MHTPTNTNNILLLLFQFNMTSTLKRRSFTVTEKLRILEMVDNRGSRPLKEIAVQHGISQSTLSTMIKDRNKIQSQTTPLNFKRQRKSDLDDIDTTLLTWLQEKRSANIPISGHILKEKANQFAHNLGYDWQCSDGWLSRFKQRHSLVNKAIIGEANVADTNAATNWMATHGKTIQEKYDAKDIFNADETGVFWRLLPSRTYAFKNESCQDGKKSKDRVTVMICANADGSEKRPLLTTSSTSGRKSCIH